MNGAPSTAGGVEGPRGPRGTSGKTIVIKKTIDEHDNKAALKKIVQKDIQRLYGTSNVLAHLKHEISKMRLLKSQDNMMCDCSPDRSRLDDGKDYNSMTSNMGGRMMGCIV
eukprot:765698-Hanusia_phi.AAC.5